MSFVIGATSKREQRERGKAGEDQMFYHISSIKVGATGVHGLKHAHQLSAERVSYWAGVVVVVVFLTTTLVAIILSPSCV
jgi:hypothetical protein